MKRRLLKLSVLLLLLGATASLALFFLLPVPQKPTKPRISASSEKSQALVNKHLWMTAQAQEMQQKKMELENSYGRLQVGDSIWPKENLNGKTIGVDHSADRNEHNAYEDLNRYNKEYQLANPDQIIQGQLADAHREQEYTEEFRAEYARQFVENARRNGYKVELDSNFVVIRVTPITKPDSRMPSLFGSPSGPQAQ